MDRVPAASRQKRGPMMRLVLFNSLWGCVAPLLSQNGKGDGERPVDIRQRCPVEPPLACRAFLLKIFFRISDELTSLLQVSRLRALRCLLSPICDHHLPPAAALEPNPAPAPAGASQPPSASHVVCCSSHAHTSSHDDLARKAAPPRSNPRHATTFAPLFPPPGGREALLQVIQRLVVVMKG
eukprot:scaffold9021_cov118-Isochrysis_galbana.AAC.3